MITFTAITHLGRCLWKYEWTATTSPYTIYWQGEEYDSTTDAEYTFAAPSTYSSEPPAIEILDADDVSTAENVANPQYAIIQWREVDNANHYLIQKYSGGAWSTQNSVPHIDRGYWSYQTGRLADVTEHQWRVVAEDEYRNQSTAKSFTFLIVRNPSAPSVGMSYSNDTGKVTISNG